MNSKNSSNDFETIINLSYYLMPFKFRPGEQCESCLLPFKNDPGKRDSNKYCSYCHQNGKMTYEGNYKGFQKAAYDAMVKNGMNKFKATFFSYIIRFAPRWQKKQE